jgi:hypothetical protein
LSTASIAVPEAFRTADQELLARNEYRATENRILKDQLKGD